MIYKITYQLKKEKNTKIHTCTTMREAEIFFDILISAGAEYICVKTFKKFGGKNE